MPFVNTYTFQASSRFERLVPVGGKPPGRHLALGGHGEAGVAAMIAADGSPLWSRRYGPLKSPLHFPLHFFDGVELPDGGFLLLSMGSGTKTYGLLRIDSLGTPIAWRTIPDLEPGEGARLLFHPDRPDEILLMARARWGSESEAGSAAELFLLALDGTPRSSARLAMSGVGRLFDGVALPRGYVLVGHGESVGRPEIVGRGLIVEVEPGLAGCRGWWVAAEGAPALSLRAATGHGANLAVAGALQSEGEARVTLAARLTIDSAGLTAKASVRYAASDGRDLPLRIGRTIGRDPGNAATGADDFYILDTLRHRGARASVIRLDWQLAASDRFDFTFDGEVRLLDMAARNRTVALAGTFWTASPRERALLLAVDQTFASCRTYWRSPPPVAPAPLAIEKAAIDLARVELRTWDAELPMHDLEPQVTRLCGDRAVELEPDGLLQSPALSLQAAGSNGTDASTGILLRWILDGPLAGHLPKGDHAKGNAFFNRPDDYVTVYRAEWPQNARVRLLDLAEEQPIDVDDAERRLVFETGSDFPRTLFYLNFPDSAAYAAAKQSADPATRPADFVAAYGPRPYEVELRGRLALACDLTFTAAPGGKIRVETRSVAENRPTAPKRTTSRRVLGAGDSPSARLVAENMRSVRLECSAAAVTAFAFSCYEDVLARLNRAKSWTEIGRFALTDDTPTALARLEEPARFQVQGRWRKFNDGAFVNVANYAQRWSDPQAGLRKAVQTYLQLSESDPAAEAVLPGAAAHDGEMTVSYLDLLQLVATDFHVARMLGMGHVDADAAAPPGVTTRTYVYLAEYSTLGDLGDGDGARLVRHLYMSLPTGVADPRLPIAPLLNRADYGLTVTTASGDPHWLTDAGGYTPDGTARYIRLYPDCPPLFEQEKGFFDPPNLFDLSRESLPVFFGVEHRLQGEPGWRRPEIAHDPDYFDTAAPARPEARPVPFGPTLTARPFPHKQTEAGVHEYAVYGVNLFSRASPTSPAFASAATTFVKANRLLPPSDLQVQFIQPESPLVLTSADEQTMLDDLVKAGKDPTLVRLCFNYGFPQEANYEFAHAVEIFHRRTPPANVTGSVAAAVPATDPSFIRIETGPFTYASTGETIQPTLAPAAKANFLGGVLAVGSRRLIIEDIAWPTGSSGDNPIFLVRKPTTTGAVGKGSLVIQNAPLDAKPGDLFMAVENMAAAASWGPGNPLGRVIALGDDPSWKTRTESFTRPDQTLVSRRLRGIWESATVAEDPPGSKHYTVTFAGYALAPHPQSAAADAVSWFRGVVRAPVTGRDPEDRRMLKVIGIGQSGGLLELRAVDDSGEAGAVATGPGRLVHYLPGYRVHLHADAASGFDRTTLMPAPGEGSRTTLLGARSVDPTTLDSAAKPYHSPVGVPQLLTAMEIIEPGTPLRPKGLKYATPPDAYGKASYTLNVEFKAAPFAVAFYRADALAILEALYEPAQQAEIRTAIFPAQADPYFANRFDDLFAFLDSNDATADLAVFPLALGDNYFLPLPNAASLELGKLPTLAERKQRMKAAMLEAFVALTEQPLIYELISTDPAFAPTNAKQVFRNADGEILAPGQAGFDLAPMAKRPGGDAVQFTDFTLEGSMNRDTVYFYLARELGNRMQLGEPSPIFGPVLLVNLAAPAAPQLRKIGSTLYDEETTLGPEVRFELLPPPATDPMARLLIYRAGNARDALSVRTMRVVQEIDVATLTPAPDGILTVADDFRNEPFIPFGEPLYYRLAWVREVHYEDAAGLAHTASVVSDPTATLLANLVDVVNPPAPVPAVAIVSTDASTGDKLIELSWAKTTHNGTYYVCQLSPSGNWFRLAALKTNSAQPSFALPAPLPTADEDGEAIYYRFKVDVENSSGLLNLLDAPITVNLADVQ